MMKWMICAVLAFATFAHAEDPAQELQRLRRENAALKAEIAKLKEELVAAKPAQPKATKYTAAELVKLIPPAQIPADGKWDGPHVSKAKKVVGAVLIGEWVQFEIPVQKVESYENHSNVQSKYMPVNSMSVFVDARFTSGAPKPSIVEGKTITVVGKVRQIEISNSMTEPLLMIVLEESRVGK